MFIRSTFAKAGLVGVAGVMALSAALSVPTFASAQSASQYDSRGYYYDPCRRDSTKRSATAGILGALAGAAIGSNVAGHRVRTEGAVLGALAGAAVGAGIGKSSAACQSQQRQGYNNGYGSEYGNNGYGSQYGNNGYYGSSSYGGYDNNRDRSNSRYDRPRYGDDNGWDRDGDRVSGGRGADANGCTLAESPIYLPDGRVQKRFVRVCRDSQGRYQTVE